MRKNQNICWLLVSIAIIVLAGTVEAAEIVEATGATASTSFYGAVATQVINYSRLNSSNQLIPGDWSKNWLFDCTTFQNPTNTDPANFTSYQWIYIDLGRNYDLDEIRIWNYFDTAENVNKRGLKDFALYVAGDGAALPTGGTIPPGGSELSPFTPEDGWEYLLGYFDDPNDPNNILTIAPQATEPIGPTDTFVVAGTNYVRYIGIDVGTSTWQPSNLGGEGGDIGGLSLIQVTGTLSKAILVPINAVASTEYGGAPAINVIDVSRLDTTNKLFPGDWSNNWLFDATSGVNNFTSYQWIYVDLGRNYDLDEIRIWNYFDTAAGVSGRGLKDFDLYVAGDGAILPIGGATPPGGVMQSPFAPEDGWEYILGQFDDPPKVLTEAPQATEPIGPTDTFMVTGTNDVRYIGIDVGLATWDGNEGGSIGGIAQIQVTAAPMIITGEPSSLTVDAGDMAVFTIEGTGVATCQWKTDNPTDPNIYDGPTGSGAVISGATTNQLTITNVQLAEEGNYVCEMADVSGYQVTTAPAQLLTKRLISHWPLENDANGIMDIVGPWDAPVTNPTYTTGIIGSGALKDTLVTVPNSSSYFNFYTRGFTSTFWIKPDAGTAWEGVMSKFDWSNSNGFHNYISEPDSIVTAMENNSLEAVGPIVVDPNHWNFIATTYDLETTTFKLYVNGLLYDRRNIVFDSQGASGVNVSLGGVNPYVFHGASDDVKLYSYALTGLELAQEYVNGIQSSTCFCSDWDITGGSPVGGDCKVDLLDFSEFALIYWLPNESGMLDLEEIASDWLKDAVIVNPN